MATQISSTTGVSSGKIFGAGATAGILAAVVNAVIWFVSNLTGSMVVSLIQVLASSIIGVAMGGIVFALLARFTKRPIQIFTVVVVTARPKNRCDYFSGGGAQLLRAMGRSRKGC